ncbi:MAG TPA: hypothetical protein DEW46_09325, partial [Verrucomicrobia bacterium]|nr:hypothetical protein [Verrucomicrobiota bacterium]
MPISLIIVGIEIEIEIGIDPCPVWHLALMHRSNFAAELCQLRTNTVEVSGCLMPESHSIPRPIATPTPIS